MRNLTEYEALRAQNEVFLYLWERIYSAFLKNIKYDMADTYEREKECFDLYEIGSKGLADDILSIDEDVGIALLKEVTIDEDGTWEDGYEFWKQKIDEKLSL